MVHTAAKESVPVLRIFLDVVNVTAIKKQLVNRDIIEFLISKPSVMCMG